MPIAHMILTFQETETVFFSFFQSTISRAEKAHHATSRQPRCAPYIYVMVMETAGRQREAGGSTCCGHYLHSTTPLLAPKQYKAPSPKQRKHIMPPPDHLDVLPIHM
jgi:hypothetical protein